MCSQSSGQDKLDTPVDVYRQRQPLISKDGSVVVSGRTRRWQLCTSTILCVQHVDVRVSIYFTRSREATSYVRNKRDRIERYEKPTAVWVIYKWAGHFRS
jgi:precorrin-3B methylase